MNYENMCLKLKEINESSTILSFEEIKALCGELPNEAQYRNWWDNSGETSQSRAWCAAGFSVSKVIPDAYVQFVRNNKNYNSTISSISISNKMDDKGKKKETSEVYITLGIVFIILDFAIGIPILFHYINEFELENCLGVLIYVVIFFIIGIICIASGSPSSLGSLPSGNYYNSNDSLSYEMQNHNRRVEQILMENEKYHLQENMYRQMHESDGSLADKFDTRITNIFRNPWDGIL